MGQAYGLAGPTGRHIGNEWLISDTHFGHGKILQYVPSRGAKWEDWKEMNEGLIAMWNATVGKGDIVYHLGDFGLSRDPREVLPRLKGRIWLLRGNHDVMLAQDWLAAGVEGILPSVWPWSRDVVFSHVPLHPMSLAGRWKLNVHGHIHDRTVMRWGKGLFGRWKSTPDRRYFNVSVEAIRFRPLSCKGLAKVVQEI